MARETQESHKTTLQPVPSPPAVQGTVSALEIARWRRYPPDSASSWASEKQVCVVPMQDGGCRSASGFVALVALCPPIAHSAERGGRRFGLPRREPLHPSLCKGCFPSAVFAKRNPRKQQNHFAPFAIAAAHSPKHGLPLQILPNWKETHQTHQSPCKEEKGFTRDPNAPRRADPRVALLLWWLCRRQRRVLPRADLARTPSLQRPLHSFPKEDSPNGAFA
jgi:hypothetical protein